VQFVVVEYAVEQRQQGERLIDFERGAPAARKRQIGHIAIAREHRRHAGRETGLDVALTVADVPAACRIDGRAFGRQQQRCGVRLGRRRGVAADDRRRRECAVTQQFLDHRLGEPRMLVGDDAPDDVAALERDQQFEYAGEQLAFVQLALVIDGEEASAVLLVLGVLGGKVEAGLEQAARAVGGIRPQRRVGKFIEAAFAAQVVDGAGEIGCAVDQGAVEVEQDGARRDSSFGHRSLMHGPCSPKTSQVELQEIGL